MKKTIGIIGGGNMGTAILKGLIENKLCPADYISVCELDNKRAVDLKRAYKVSTGDLNTVISNAEIIILAVKPQDMESVLSQIRQTEGKLFISVAAGLTTKFFEKQLGGKVRVIRAMPNLPALIGKGITGYCAGQFVKEGDEGNAGLILEALGGAIRFKESEMDAVTAVSGSGPAYVFFFVEQWIDAAVKLGLNQREARYLVHQTVRGSAEFLKDSINDVSGLRAMVTSKGGTTEAAMKVFLKGDKLGKLMKDALTAAKKRAGELAK
jgi:pyrroline-5-carboxylate reductase